MSSWRLMSFGGARVAVSLDGIHRLDGLAGVSARARTGSRPRSLYMPCVILDGIHGTASGEANQPGTLAAAMHGAAQDIG